MSGSASTTAAPLYSITSSARARRLARMASDQAQPASWSVERRIGLGEVAGRLLLLDRGGGILRAGPGGNQRRVGGREMAARLLPLFSQLRSADLAVQDQRGARCRNRRSR